VEDKSLKVEDKSTQLEDISLKVEDKKLLLKIQALLSDEKKYIFFAVFPSCDKKLLKVD
jgi:hypothetical protein